MHVAYNIPYAFFYFVIVAAKTERAMGSDLIAGHGLQ